MHFIRAQRKKPLKIVSDLKHPYHVVRENFMIPFDGALKNCFVCPCLQGNSSLQQFLIQNYSSLNGNKP